MWWLVSIAFTPAVDAADFFDSIGEPIEMPLASGWPRTFPKDDGSGWWFLAAQGGNYNLMTMSNDYVLDTTHNPITPPTADLDNDGQMDPVLKDHAITRCPDGTYLHTASANLTCPSCNDSLYAFRYDADFNLLSWSAIEERETSRDHNDMPVSCGYGLDLTCAGGTTNYGIDIVATFFRINADSTPGESKELINTPKTGGNTFIVDEVTHNLHIVELDNTYEMRISTLDQDLEILDVNYALVLEQGHKGGWPQAVLRVEDTYLVAFINQGGPGEWMGLVGDVNIAFFDSEWNLKESVQVTNLEPSSGGAMTPGLSLRDDTLLLTFDKNVVPHVVVMDLNMEAFGEEDPDSGDPNPDTSGSDSGSDTSGSGNKKDGASCGCSSRQNTPQPWLALLGFAAFRRRKSDPQT